MKRITLVATGGTIQNTEEGRIPVDDVLAELGNTDDYPTVQVRDLLRKGSESLTPSDWLDIARAVQEACDDPTTDAVVVTHGTFTAEETSYFLHLTIDSDKPIVLVVSQRKHGALGNDGTKNLRDALRVAASKVTRGQGVVLVENEKIHSARDVVKENQRPGAFESPVLGALGTIELDKPSMYRSPLRLHTYRSMLRGAFDDSLPRVEIVTGFAGADGGWIRELAGSQVPAIVVSGFAYSGVASDDQMRALHDAWEAGTMIVLASRGRGGRIPHTRRHPFVTADNLTPQKARVLAMLALVSDRGTPEELQRLYDTH